jgi:hypothetical protein
VSALVVGLPGVILYFGSDVAALMRGAADGDHDARVALIGIAVQEMTIVGASSLPILLYFVFDREKLRTLRNKFTRQIFRLDPGVRTLRDVEAKYGEILDEAYGRGSTNRFLPGTRSPILIATSVMALGWTIALLDTDVAATSTQASSLNALIEPTPAAPTFAFLGAYFFTLNQVLRGYVRGDLRPKTYAHVATRTVGVVVLSYLLGRLLGAFGADPSHALLLTLAFIAGVVPETVLVRIQEIARGVARTRTGRSQLERAATTFETEPLTQIQGIDIYDRARLLDEGVTNVEALAHHNLVDLLLRTRIPASRLVDWVDQAILYIHCVEQQPPEDEDAPGVLARLRAHGIRTATGLERAYDAACKRGGDDAEALVRIAGPARGGPPVLRAVLDTLRDEDWMPALRRWHSEAAEPDALQLPEDLEALLADQGLRPHHAAAGEPSALAQALGSGRR